MKKLLNFYKYSYVYMIKNLINGHRYVGFHVSNLEFEEDNYFGSGKLLHEKINEYGIQNFVMGIIEYINVNEWREKEIFWIKKMKSHVSFGQGYNLTWGGDGCLGLKQTPEHTEKIRQKNLGLKRSKETIELLILKKQNISEKSREKMRNAKLNTHQSEETIRKRKEKLSGLKRKPEFGQNISEKRKGMKFSEEHKQNLSKALSGRHLSQETKDKLRNYHKNKKLIV